MRRLKIFVNIAMIILVTGESFAQNEEISTKSYPAMDERGIMVSHEFNRRALQDNDVLIGQPSFEDVPSVSTQVLVENPSRKMYFPLVDKAQYIFTG